MTKKRLHPSGCPSSGASPWTSLWASLCLALLASGCASAARSYAADNPPDAVLAWAQQARTAGDPDAAIEALAYLRTRAGLAPEMRNRAEDDLTDVVTERIAQLEGSEDAGDALGELFSVELPRRLRSVVGIAAARAQLAEGRRVESFQTIRKVDEKNPGHAERNAAAQILAQAGLSLARDPGHFFLGLFSYRSRAPRVLEYLVLTYPAHPRCAEAYDVLARLYEEDGEWDLAIARREELILYHRASPYGIASELRIPELRMLQLKRVDYDRGGLIRARDELRTWLGRHAGDPLEPTAHALLAECMDRLAQNDMQIARFYADVDRPYGAWQHAERALLEAEESGNPQLAADVRAFLDGLPSADQLLKDVGQANETSVLPDGEEE